MKYLKSYNEGVVLNPSIGEFLTELDKELRHEGFIFESNYQIEEYISELSNKLGSYNLSPVQIRELVSRLDIDSYISDGISPSEVISELDTDMCLSKNGYPSININKPKQTIIKYL